MKIYHRLAIYIAMTLGNLLLASSFVHAEESEDIYEMSLEELLRLKVVEVTARKRTEDRQKIPVSISVLDTEKISQLNAGARDWRFLSNRVPSLHIESSFDRLFPRFYIRGLGNTDFDINASQPVSVVMDGVVQENSMLKGFPVFDTKRIEILKGPQGTTFGRNTPAGVIKFESNKPSNQAQGYANFIYGSNQTAEIEGAFNLNVSKYWNARISILNQQRSDWIDNLAPDFKKSNVLGGFTDLASRLQVMYKKGEQNSLLINYHWRDFDANPAVFRANIIQPNTNQLVTAFDQGQIFLDAADRTYQRLKSSGANVTLSHQFDQILLTSISGYESLNMFSRGDVDGGYGAAFVANSGPGAIPFPAENASRIPNLRQLTQEIRFSNLNDRRVDYQLGIFYFDESVEIDSLSFDSLLDGTINGFSSQRQDTRAWAVFATIDYDLIDALKMTAGLRYSSDDKNYYTERTMSPIGAADQLAIKDQLGGHHISWDISAIYSASDDINYYLRVADTFRAPSIQGRLTFGDEVTSASSETVISMEAGVKAIVSNGQGRIDANLYRLDMANQQITAVGGEFNTNRLINVEQTDGFGFEFESEFIINENWSWYGNLSYNRTRINDPDLSVSVCSQCNVIDPINSDGFALIDGNNLPNSPRNIYNLGVEYRQEIGIGELEITTDWSYRSEIDFFLYHSKEFVGAPLLEGGIKASYSWKSTQFEYQISLSSRNITNQTRLIGGVDFNNLTGIVNEPRYTGLEFTIKL